MCGNRYCGVCFSLPENPCECGSSHSAKVSLSVPLLSSSEGMKWGSPRDDMAKDMSTSSSPVNAHTSQTNAFSAVQRGRRQEKEKEEQDDRGGSEVEVDLAKRTEAFSITEHRFRKVCCIFVVSKYFANSLLFSLRSQSQRQKRERLLPRPQIRLRTSQRWPLSLAISSHICAEK